MLLMSDEFQLGTFLESCGRSAHELAVGKWRVTAGTERKVAGILAHQAEWISLEFPWKSQDADDPAQQLIDLATLCRTLPESLKFSREHADPLFDLRCEIRDTGESREPFATRHAEVEADDPGGRTSLAMRVDVALQAIDRVLDSSPDALKVAATTRTLPVISTAPEQTTSGAAGSRSDLARLCAEAGWSCHERAGGRVAVPLDVSGQFCEAMLMAGEQGGVRIEYVLDAGDRSSVSAAASSLFLLRANRVYRMARLSMTYSPARARTADSGEVAGGLSGVRFVWDVVLPEPAGPADLNAALSALSVACRGTVRELQVLADDRVAREYLAIQGMVL
jgi:hypothetical protein